MLKIQNSIRNIFATTEDTKDQITDPDRQCPTEHTTTIPTATPFLVVEIFPSKNVNQFTKFRQSVSRQSKKIQ